MNTSSLRRHPAKATNNGGSPPSTLKSLYIVLAAAIIGAAVLLFIDNNQQRYYLKTSLRKSADNTIGLALSNDDIPQVHTPAGDVGSEVDGDGAEPQLELESVAVVAEFDFETTVGTSDVHRHQIHLYDMI